MGKVFANGPGDLGSIPGRVIPKTLKMVLDTSLLNTQQYKVRIKVKWSNPGKGVAPSPTPRCSSYWKGGFRETTLLFTYYLCHYFHLQIHWNDRFILIPSTIFLAGNSSHINTHTYTHLHSHTHIHTHTHTHIYIYIYIYIYMIFFFFVGPKREKSKKNFHVHKEIYFWLFILLLHVFLVLCSR